MPNELVKVYCPTCRTWLMMVGTETTGRVSPYCKKCKENKIIQLSAKCQTTRK